MYILAVTASKTHHLSLSYRIDSVEPLGGVVVAEIYLRLVPKLLIQIKGPKVLQVCI